MDVRQIIRTHYILPSEPPCSFQRALPFSVRIFATLTSSGSDPDTRQRQDLNPQAIFSMAHLFSRQRRYNHFGTLAKCTRRKLHPLFNLQNCYLLQLVAILFLLRTCAVRKEASNIRKEPVNLSEFPISSLALCLATGSNQYMLLFLHQIPVLCRH